MATGTPQPASTHKVVDKNNVTKFEGTKGQCEKYMNDNVFSGETLVLVQLVASPTVSPSVPVVPSIGDGCQVMTPQMAQPKETKLEPRLITIFDSEPNEFLPILTIGGANLVNFSVNFKVNGESYNLSKF